MMNKIAPLTGVSALALALSLAGAAADEKTAWRLFVADHEKPVVHAIDAITGNRIESFAVEGAASLRRSESGRTIFAIQGSAGNVTAIGSGIGFEDHGDHGDIRIEAPKLLGVEIAGEKPSHVVEHAGEITLFFDGDGIARILSEAAILDGKPETRDVAAAAPHHGVAVAYGKHVLLSEPTAEKPDELPEGIKVVDAQAAQVGEIAGCPDLHGEASSGNILVFACATGLLVVRSGGDAPEIAHLAYPDSLPEGKVTTLVGGRGLQYFLGNFGASAVVLIDPTLADGFRLVELPMRRVHFAVDPIRPRFAYIFTEDGTLHRLNVLTGVIEGSLALTDTYSMDGHWSDPRPRIAVAGDRIVVTDPLKSRLRLVDAETFTADGDIAVEGKPYIIVAVGGSGETHEGD